MPVRPPEAEPRRTGSRCAERTDLIWHGYFPDVRRASSTATACTGRTSRRRATASTPTSSCSTRTPGRSSGEIHWDDALFGYTIGDPDEDRRIDERDSAPHMPKCVVIDPAFTWGDDRPPRTPWNRSVIYETHVRGMTMRHPASPEELRGTYLAHGLRRRSSTTCSTLGVTAVELLPVHQFVNDRHLDERGLTNYWGYNSIGFFAPDSALRDRTPAGEQVREFKRWSSRSTGPASRSSSTSSTTTPARATTSGRRCRSAASTTTRYYRLVPEDPRYYFDFTGTGNSLNMRHPRTLQLIMDSLRYWVTDMHVDGFRFDLAPTLARELYEVDRLAAFFDIIQQDPILSQVKLIAEPWDVGDGGYQVGNFPVGWAEWNDKYRDGVRPFWRGDPGRLARAGLAARGLHRPVPAERPAHLRQRQLRHRPRRLHARRPDRVRAEAQRGQRRGQPRRHQRQPQPQLGRRGADRRRGRGRCASGCSETSSPRCCSRRACAMLLGGDEIGRTQGGNNNAYCQDNEISWFDWELDRPSASCSSSRGRSGLFHENPVLRHRDFFTGRPGGRRRQGRPLAAAGRRRDGRRRLDARQRARARPAARRPRHRRGRRARPSDLGERCCC